MTKIYTYCLFDGDDTFHGVYSSLSAAYRDALKIANRGQSAVKIRTESGWSDPSLTTLRNVLYGRCDVVVTLQGGRHRAKILKTKLKE
jgi:hypothetical protein